MEKFYYYPTKCSRSLKELLTLIFNLCSVGLLPNLQPSFQCSYYILEVHPLPAFFQLVIPGVLT